MMKGSLDAENEKATMRECTVAQAQYDKYDPIKNYLQAHSAQGY